MSAFWSAVKAGAKTKTGQKIISALTGGKQKTTGTEVITSLKGKYNIKKKKKKSWKDHVDTSHPSYKRNWPPGETKKTKTKTKHYFAPKDF